MISAKMCQNFGYFLFFYTSPPSPLAYQPTGQMPCMPDGQPAPVLGMGMRFSKTIANKLGLPLVVCLRLIKYSIHQYMVETPNN